MENTMNFELTSEEAKQLSELIEMCVQELSETNESMARRRLEIDKLQDETQAILARMQQRLKKGWDEGAIFRTYSAAQPTIEQLAYDVKRLETELRHSREREADARERLRLEMENKILREKCQLPSANRKHDAEDK